MHQAEPGKHLKVAVTATLEDGTVALQATPEQPLEFTLGQKGILKGFADALVGMTAGDSKSVAIPARDAFGEEDPAKRVFVNKAQIRSIDDFSVGDHVSLMPQGGREISGWIEKFDGKDVVINRNHRLAGKDLQLEIELLDVA